MQLEPVLNRPQFETGLPNIRIGVKNFDEPCSKLCHKFHQFKPKPKLTQIYNQPELDKRLPFKPRSSEYYFKPISNVRASSQILDLIHKSHSSGLHFS
jgi:hypothetical protein